MRVLLESLQKYPRRFAGNFQFVQHDVVCKNYCLFVEKRQVEKWLFFNISKASRPLLSRQVFRFDM